MRSPLGFTVSQFISCRSVSLEQKLNGKTVLSMLGHFLFVIIVHTTMAIKVTEVNVFEAAYHGQLWVELV